MRENALIEINLHFKFDDHDSSLTRDIKIREITPLHDNDVVCTRGRVLHGSCRSASRGSSPRMYLSFQFRDTNKKRYQLSNSLEHTSRLFFDISVKSSFEKEVAKKIPLWWKRQISYFVGSKAKGRISKRR